MAKLTKAYTIAATSVNVTKTWRSKEYQWLVSSEKNNDQKGKKQGENGNSPVS